MPVERGLMDANVLVYALDADAPQHTGWLERNVSFMPAFEQNRTVSACSRLHTFREPESTAALTWCARVFSSCESAAH